KIENLDEVRVKELRSGTGTEFRNHKLEEFCDERGISQNFSSPYTVEQNGVAERRKRTLIEAARTMLNSLNLLKQFWEEAINNTYYTQNRCIIVKRHGKIAYDVFRGRSPDDEAISKSSTKGDEINFNENKSFLDDEFLIPRNKVSQCFGNDDYFAYVPAHDPLTINNISILDNLKTLELLRIKSLSSLKPVNNVEPSPTIISSSTEVFIDPPILQDRWSREKHIELVNILSEPHDGVTTRSRIRDSKAASAHECLYLNFLSKIEPNKLIEALEEEE
ncbi:retrovirus-related pol polyprotein from transposon TNT 1-94, partial [Tanacetum coccineum]